MSLSLPQMNMFRPHGKVVPFVRLVLLVHILRKAPVSVAFSTPTPEVMPRQFIEITNPIDTTAENKLPSSFVSNWPTWILESDGRLTKIPDDSGFVQPASVDELWQPVDLIRPDLRLAIGIHVRGGEIRHVMPAVDLTYSSADRPYRNRGMCSVPRAYGWMDFSNALDEWYNYRLAVYKRKRTTEGPWEELSQCTTGAVSNAIERAVMCLAESAPDEMATGSHFVNVPLLKEDGSPVEALDCPKSGFEMKVAMDDDDFLSPQASSPGMLQVVVSATIAGSESEFLPEVYKPLYNDESLRNPLYAKFMSKKAKPSKD